MLEKLGLVDGIVSEDSDTFIFGGQVVYKNIFQDKKYVEVYHAKDAWEEMNLTQDALVALAMLLGGDYTEGVKGVGIGTKAFMYKHKHMLRFYFSYIFSHRHFFSFVTLFSLPWIDIK